MPFYTETGLANLAYLIRTNREKRGMSLRQFAEMVGVTHKTIDRLESCRFKNPTNEKLAQIAPYLGCTLEELLAIASEKDRDPEQPSGVASPIQTAEDLLPLLSNLPTTELERLAQALESRLLAIKMLEKNFSDF